MQEGAELCANPETRAMPAGRAHGERHLASVPWPSVSGPARRKSASHQQTESDRKPGYERERADGDREKQKPMEHREEIEKIFDIDAENGASVRVAGATTQYGGHQDRRQRDKQRADGEENDAEQGQPEPPRPEDFLFDRFHLHPGHAGLRATARRLRRSKMGCVLISDGS
jgi:hypothetical protein